MISRLTRIFVLAVLVVALGRPAAAEGSPKGLVERLNATLIEVMQNAGKLGYQGRYDKLAPVLNQTFNYPLMARVSVGPYWSKLDEGDRARLTDTFARLSAATFAARFDGYSGEAFQILGALERPRKTVLVRNDLVKKSGEVVPLNYLAGQYGGQWRIVDVFLDAKYSELALKRSEYTSVVKRDGFARLIDLMEEKIADMAGDSGG